ncbi:MAG TPA: hypothetical protein VLZ75_06400 [Chitinophagales bacterium]|nr:hypothetical protein [Chitinophagales bacterium]
MKKLFYSVFLFVASATFMTSCQKEVAPIVEQSLSAKLSQDDNFQKMMASTVTMATSFSADAISQEDGALILEIVQKGNKASVSEREFVQSILGASPEKFGTELTAFLGSLAELENSYSLSKLSQAELNTAISGAIELNPALKQQLTTAAHANGKAEVTGAAICRLVVLLAGTFGGTALCGVIGVATIPVIGGVLCTALVGLATNILNAVCDLIP